jgi:membrane fusion protein, multidrug efflux system
MVMPKIGDPLQNRFRVCLAPGTILTLAIAAIVVISGHWNNWVSQREEQTADDAYIRADVTPLSTKAAD